MRDIVQGKVRWVNVKNPTDADIAWLGKTFHFHPIILEELKGPSARDKMEVHKNYLYLIYYFPIYDPVERVSRRAEIDFLVTKRDVITVSYESVEAFDDLKKKLNPKHKIFNETLLLTHELLESLLGFEQRQLRHIREKVEAVSAELFRDRERERERILVERISYLKRDVSQYRVIVRPQNHILESFLESGIQFWGEGARVYLNDLVGEHLKIIDQLEDYRQAIEDFGRTNNQLINLKHAEVTKTFTVLAFLTFPMMLFAALFSMNTRDTPLVEVPYAFWIIIGVMVGAMTGMYLYFRKKDWI